MPGCCSLVHLDLSSERQGDCPFFRRLTADVAGSLHCGMKLDLVFVERVSSYQQNLKVIQ